MMEQLFQTAREEGLEINDDRFAQLLDDRDPLKFLRGQFHVPTVSEVLDNKVTEGVDGSKKCVYLAGNSLGLQPKGTQQLVLEELEKWKTRGVLGHFEGQRPWAPIEDVVNKQSGVLVGSHDPPTEVVIMNG
ncbi:kynureninase-like, partial [Dysidea avara]|uniref:kynureninase-like n=1 Tax=Dysidea avara TaxID=196820 RepID=UPI003317340F